MNVILKRKLKGALGVMPIRAQFGFASLLETIERQKTVSLLKQIMRIQPAASIVDIDEVGVFYGLNSPYKVCHILGSGWSLPLGLNLISQENDLVLGFNFSALMWENPHIYFIELASDKTSHLARVSDAQFTLVKELGLLDGNRVVFKNVWESNNTLQSIIDNYSSNALILKDSLVRGFSLDMLASVAEKILEPHNGFVRQYSSSTLTLISAAYRWGFKKIVLHGIDFGGPHFYDLPDFSTNSSLEGVVQAVKKPLVNKSIRHLTASDKLGQQAVIPLLKNRLSIEGVELFAASAESPLADILPVYKL